MHAEYGEERRGQPPYDPRMMTKLLVYGYCVGVFSSRKIQQRLQEDIAFRVLAAGNSPRMARSGQIRGIRVGKLWLWRFRRSEIDMWIERNLAS